MKKYCAILFAVVIILGLTGCKTKEEKDKNDAIIFYDNAVKNTLLKVTTEPVNLKGKVKADIKGTMISVDEPTEFDITLTYGATKAVSGEVVLPVSANMLNIPIFYDGNYLYIKAPIGNTTFKTGLEQELKDKLLTELKALRLTFKNEEIASAKKTTDGDGVTTVEINTDVDKLSDEVKSAILSISDVGSLPGARVESLKVDATIKKYSSSYMLNNYEMICVVSADQEMSGENDGHQAVVSIDFSYPGKDHMISPPDGIDIEGATEVSGKVPGLFE